MPIKRRKSYDELRNELEKGGGVAWQHGMELRNANGNIDSSTLGYQYTIQTTTLIRAHVIEQKFYEIPFADYVPVVIGEGAYLENIKTNVEYQSGQDFESGLQGTAQEARIKNVDVGIAPITAVIKTWAAGYEYNDLEVEKALASDNWDVIRGKMKALKKNWDLGIQRVAFLGTYSDATNAPGLLSNASVTVNTTRITANISSLSSANFATLVAGILADYFANANSTVLPDTLEIPMADYLGLATPVASGFPNVSMLTYLLDAFKQITGNPNFKIYGLAYGNAATNAGVWTANGTYRYCLYRRDEETVRMDIPLDFVLRAPATPNNFAWQGVSLGQFTGTIVYRPPEVLYFDHT